MDNKCYNVNGHLYTPVKIIGKGTYGTVYLYQEENSDLRIIKEILNKANDKQNSQEAENEIKVISKLRHPFITQYYDSWYDEIGAYIIMEYATHGNLAEFMFLKQPSLILQAEVIFYFCQILLGVQHIHSKNIIHRDLKAENILLTGPNGIVVKVGDFGIAKILEENKTKTIIGTPYYIAPELCDNKPYDTKTDIWALGCLFYEMCTHKRAFEAETLAGLVKQITTGNVQPISKVVYEYGIQIVIDNMLTVEPEKRPTINVVLGEKVLISTVYNVFLNASDHMNLYKYYQSLFDAEDLGLNNLKI